MCRQEENPRKSDGLVQVIVDKFDAELSSANYRLSTHDLATIETHAMEPPHIVSDVIPRLSKADISLSICPEEEDEMIPYVVSTRKLLPPPIVDPDLPDEFLVSKNVTYDRAGELDSMFLKVKDYLASVKLCIWIPCSIWYELIVLGIHYIANNIFYISFTGSYESRWRKHPRVEWLEHKWSKGPRSYASSQNTYRIPSFYYGPAIRSIHNVHLHVKGKEKHCSCGPRVHSLYSWPTDIQSGHSHQVGTSSGDVWHNSSVGGMHFLTNVIGCIGDLAGVSGCAEILSVAFASVPKCSLEKLSPKLPCSRDAYWRTFYVQSYVENIQTARNIQCFQWKICIRTWILWDSRVGQVSSGLMSWLGLRCSVCNSFELNEKVSIRFFTERHFIFFSRYWQCNLMKLLFVFNCPFLLQVTLRCIWNVLKNVFLFSSPPIITSIFVMELHTFRWWSSFQVLYSRVSWKVNTQCISELACEIKSGATWV